ncbi:hypothetical protein V2J09_019341 [Rumex salicifolius]
MAPPNGEIVPATAANTAGNTIHVSDLPRFDVVDADPSDHHYFSSSKVANAANAKTTFHKKIMQEWRVLGSNLPGTIFVRVYETHISLIRAAIVGAPETPYHDGLFFFDIFLPADYPFSPPHVHYRSFGFRINPNLYNSGRVCLSLLNTWSGNKSEKWDRNQSTILQAISYSQFSQVLLSIQALVLNEKPYFNEPGYSNSRGKKVWEKAAADYSEDVFILCCKSALCLLRKPPANFESLVASHFRERGVAILTACNAYRSGLARVGDKVSVTGARGGVKNVTSSRFKGMIEKVYGDLVVAFAKNGAPVGHFVKQLADEREAKVLAAKRKLEAKALEAKRKLEKKIKEQEKKKAAREAMKKRLMAIVEKIWVGLGLKNSSKGNDQVEVKVVN